MVRKMIGTFLMVFALLTGMSWAEDGYPQPYTGDLVGTWGFNGGAEEHGDGFRLDADGTGVNLEIVDYEQAPLQFRETDSTFTWRVENVTDRVYLHETYADGNTVTHEIETWGGARIHIPNEMSGGFYFPVLDDAAAAYLASKPEHSAFDGVIADYLDGSITRKLEAAGLYVGEIYLQQEEGAWRIVVKTHDRKFWQEHRFILDEESIIIWVDDFVWLWGDYDLGQPWFAPDTTERYYTGLPGILQSYLTWEYDPQPTPTPEPPALPELTAQLGSFPKNKTYEVYESLVGGDDEPNRRAGNGRAKVSTNGAIWVYATWRSHLLIEYEIDPQEHRIGWISADALPASTLPSIPALSDSRSLEENIYSVTLANTFLTDDPLYSQGRITYINAGTSVHVLARLEDWLLVQGFVDGELRMGFVRQDKVDLEHGYSASPKKTIGHCSRYTEADVQAAFDALAQCIWQSWPGTGLAAVRYDENDADEAYSFNPWWTDDAGEREGILLLADLSSMQLWHFEISGSLATDYIFILQREPGGEWAVVNWGYT